MDRTTGALTRPEVAAEAGNLAFVRPGTDGTRLYAVANSAMGLSPGEMLAFSVDFPIITLRSLRSSEVKRGWLSSRMVRYLGPGSLIWVIPAKAVEHDQEMWVDWNEAIAKFFAERVPPGDALYAWLQTYASAFAK